MANTKKPYAIFIKWYFLHLWGDKQHPNLPHFFFNSVTDSQIPSCNRVPQGRFHSCPQRGRAVRLASFTLKLALPCERGSLSSISSSLAWKKALGSAPWHLANPDYSVGQMCPHIYCFSTNGSTLLITAAD